MASSASHSTLSSSILSAEEGRQLFDEFARELLHMDGEEFMRRWNAGEYEDLEDIPENGEILYLSMLMPFGRREL
ncbi:MAG: hypothetical protein H0W06_09270 [Chloroflexia bacterium]|nr:hypothetical protein [Chloroflexia bacterium]